MTNITRKRIWPVSLVATLGVVAMLAILAAVMWPTGAAQAQEGLPPAFPPGKPTGLTATGDSATQISLSWTHVGLAADRYDVERKSGSGAFANVGMPTTTSFMDSGLTASTDYIYRVRAVNAAGNGSWSDEMTGTTMVAGTSEITTPAGITITSDSSTSSASPEIKVVINSLSENLPVGSQIVLYLEDDYQEPSSIPSNTVYFVADSPTSVSTGYGARVYATAQIKIDTDDYFDATKNDIRIAIPIPDLCTSSTDACQGPNGPMQGQRLTMIVQDNSGIKNPSEAGKHSAAVRIVGPADSLADPTIERADATAAEKMDGNVQGGTGSQKDKFVLLTVAKVSLSDNNNKRSYEMTVTGSGYNDGTTATAYTLAMPNAAQWWDSLDCPEMITAAGMTPSGVKATDDANAYCKPYVDLDSDQKTKVQGLRMGLAAGFKLGANGCDVVVASGTAIGAATVGSDDNASISVTVSVPTFKPGKVNYICVSDGEARGSGSDVEIFELEDSIRVVPAEVNAGDTVTVFAQDFQGTPSFFELKLGGEVVSGHTIGSIGSDGSATGTFVMPSTIGGNPVKGIIRVDGRWGSATGPTANTKITVIPAALSLTKTEALPNQSITIQGTGFGNSSDIDPMKITIDGVPLLVDGDSLRDDVVNVSNGGQFVATVYLWPEGEGTNPALVAGTHTIRVVDKKGFVGLSSIAILEPKITVVPLVAGPRDIVVIRGENFPVDNVDGGAVNAVTITVNDSRERNYSEIPDGSGRFTIEHKVSSNVAIPSVATIKATYGSEITQIGSFEVPEAIITVEPAQAAPGDTLSLTVKGMPVHATVDSVTVGGREALGNLNLNTDRNGDVMATGIVVPGLDPGIFSVQLEVNDIVAIGQVEVVAEGPTGLSSAVGDALAAVGDNLVVVWHFNTTSKVWTFYDPRPETAEFNTLSALTDGQAYLVLVSETQQDVVLNNETRNLTCVGGDCWNQMVW